MKNHLILEDNVRDTYIRVVWTHKIQEKQADILNNRYMIYEIIRISLSAVTAAGVFSLIFREEFWIKVLSTIVTFLNLYISKVLKTFEIKKDIFKHKKTAIELLVLRDKFMLLLLEINIGESNFEKLLEKYKSLQNSLWEVYKNAPITTDKAQKKANHALKIKNDNKFSEIEIDMNLPESLKRRKKENDSKEG